MRILLVHPPGWSPFYPYISIPSLAAYLKKHNYKVKQKDLNVESFDFFIKKDILEFVKEKIFNELQLIPKESIFYKPHLMAIRELPKIIKRIDEAKETLRDKNKFYKLKYYQKAVDIIRRASRCISLAFYPVIYHHYDFDIPHSRESLTHFKDTLIDEDRNIFIKFYKNILPELLKEDFDVVGISFTGQTQLIPGLSLAKMIKEMKPQSFIVAGGTSLNYIDYRLDEVLSDFSDCLNAFILYEGEKPLLKLVHALEQKKDLKDVPNLVYYDSKNNSIKKNKIEPPEDINRLPAPSFDNLPFEIYLSPKLILPVLLSRGCYWSKCAFCSIPYGSYGEYGYRVKKISRVVDELEELSEKYNISNFDFCDEAIPPKIYEKLSKELINRKLKFNFKSFARFEKGFSKKLCRQMSQAGFKFILFGLESINNKVLHLMNKGTNRGTIAMAIKNIAKAGILTHASLMFNFPGESKAQAYQTVKFAFKFMSYLHSVYYNNYGLSMQSEVVRNPKKFGLKDLKKHKGILEDYHQSQMLPYNLSEGEFNYLIYKKHLYEPFWRNFIWSNHIQLYLERIHPKNFLKEAKKFAQKNRRKLLKNFHRNFQTTAPQFDPDRQISYKKFIDSLNSKKFEESISFFKKLVKRYPREAPLVYSLAFLYFASGNISLAYHYTNMSLKLNHFHAPSYYLLSLIYFYKGDLAKAKNNILIAIKLEPRNYQYKDLLDKVILEESKFDTKE